MARAVLISGASTGIGEACALRLDRLGYQVFAGVRKQEDSEKLASRASDRLRPVTLDVTNNEHIGAVADLIKQEVGDRGLWGLVNNAGIPVAGPLEFIDLDDLRLQFEVNVFGHIAVTQSVMPLIRAATGRIVMMSSIGGRMSTALIGPYNSSKFAIEALGDALRQELAAWGIEVVVVEPGNIKTPIWEKGVAESTERLSKYPPEAMTLYGDAIAEATQAAVGAATMGISPDAVAKVVARALGSRRPRTRYLVGVDARIQAILARFVPDRLRDRIVAKLVRALARRAS